MGPKKRNKRKKPKKPKKLLENKLKPTEKKAKPPLLFQTKKSTRELTNRKLTAGTVRSVIFTLKCTETSCKQRKYKNSNNLKTQPTNTQPTIIIIPQKNTSFTSFLLDFMILFGFSVSDLHGFGFLRIFQGFFTD